MLYGRRRRLISLMQPLIARIQFDKTKSEILASLELERTNASLGFKDLFWDNSSTQTGRRIRIGVIVQSLQYLQGFAPNVARKSTLSESNHLKIGTVSSSTTWARSSKIILAVSHISETVS